MTTRDDLRAAADLDNVIEGVHDITDGGSEGEDVADESGYTRRVRIPIPIDAADIYDIGEIEVSIRMVLTALAADCPRKAASVTALRDDFFGGDHEDDYDWSCMKRAEPDMGWELRAELAVERRRGAAKRAAARAKLEAEAASIVEQQAAFCVGSGAAHLAADVENEIMAISVECEIVETLQRALEAQWQAFVLERHHYTDEQANKRRAQLLSEAEDLRMRDSGASARLRDLSTGFYEL